MAKRILVVPDVHGRDFWKEPVLKYKEQVDRIVFLGDYLDPYPSEPIDHSPDSVYANFLEIMNLKQENMEKVVLLKGNHDEHYSSHIFNRIAGGTRQDKVNWEKYHETFNRHAELFKIAHLETVNGMPYVFSHAGMTLYWIHKVNTSLWKMADNRLSIADPKVIERINELDTTPQGQEMLAVIGYSRTLFGERTGSVLWADIEEHSFTAPSAYGLDKVFQVFGHTRLRESHDSILSDHLAMIDSRQCFMIDEEREEKIEALKYYEN